ncbi:MAG: sodium:solute symporter family protein [Clostridiales Family XIII bacterium]|jgi:SSS family solute:Na+ symporter|nr:sodium:solute symporter family protein [Clostridiales Family XIII bacterium]
MSSNAWISILLIVAFFVVNAVIIKLLSKKQDSLEEYGVGNRSFGWLLNAFAYIGGWYTGTTYTGWFSNASTIGVFAQYVIVYSITSLFIMFFMARPVWVLGKVYGLETQGDLIELRYGSRPFKFVFAFLTFLFWSPWLILEIKSIGYVVQAATYQSIGFNVGLIVVSVFVIAYCFLGGSRASAVGGLVQGITFTVVGVIAVYWLIVKTYGGLGDMYEMVENFNSDLLTLGALGGKYWFSVVITCTLGGYILPGVFATIYRADSSRAVKKSVLIAPLAGILIGFTVLALGLGLTSFADFPEDPQGAAFWISGKFGGPIMVGLMGILALAACMSTISAVLNTAAVLISKDLCGTVASKMSREKLFKAARILTILVGIIAIIIATREIPNLMFISIVMYDCSVQAFPAVFIGLFWRRINIQGVSVGFIVGCIISIVGNFFPATIAWAGGWSGGILGLFANLIIVLVCGIAFKPYHRVDELFHTVRTYKEVYSKRVI